MKKFPQPVPAAPANFRNSQRIPSATTLSDVAADDGLDEDVDIDNVSSIDPSRKVPVPAVSKPILKQPNPAAAKAKPSQQDNFPEQKPVKGRGPGPALNQTNKLPAIVLPGKTGQNKELQQQDISTQDFEMPPEKRTNKKKIETRVLKERLRSMRDRFAEVSDGLKCGICGAIFIDAVQIVHVDCNHVYCERCLETRTVEESACPECGFPFTPNLVKPAKNINNIILDQQVPCFFEPAGCMDSIKFRDLEEHERHCEFNPDRMLECICGQEMHASKHANHLNTECQEFLLDCPHGCGEKVKRKFLLRHEDYECVLKPVRCEFAKFGCTFKGPRSDLYKHNKEQFQAHMGMMAGRIQDLESETKKMHVQQRESQREVEKRDRQGAVEASGFEKSYGNLMPDLIADDSRRSLYTVADSRMKLRQSDPTGTAPDAMFGGRGSDRVLPKGLTVMNELLRPKWSRLSVPKRIIESPRDGTYRFVRPFSCAFVTDYTLVMADCKTTWMIDVETGSVRNTLDPLTSKSRQLYRPRGVAVQETGLRVFVADSQADSVHVFSPSGEYAMSFGKEKLKYPMGITTYYNRVYVCDTHHKTVQIFDSAGTHVGTLAEEYHGIPEQAAASETTGLVYVTMNSSTDSYVLVIDHMGEFVTTFGYRGDDLGTLNKARGITVDPHDNVFVSNANNYKVQMFGKIATKNTLRERRRWENRVREQIWLDEMQKREPQWDDDEQKGATGGADVGQDSQARKTFEERVEDRLKKRPTEMELPEYEYRPVEWLNSEDLCSPCGLAISPNKTMLALVDEVKNKLYIY